MTVQEPVEAENTDLVEIDYEELVAALRDQIGRMSLELTKQTLVLNKQRGVIGELQMALVAKSRTDVNGSSSVDEADSPTD